LIEAVSKSYNNIPGDNREVLGEEKEEETDRQTYIQTKTETEQQGGEMMNIKSIRRRIRQRDRRRRKKCSRGVGVCGMQTKRMKMNIQTSED